MKPQDLPVYQQKSKIIESLREQQVIVIESPTGSGKTTQIPIILHEAGFADHGIIGITQPRRIATLSVSDFISRQLGTPVPGLVGYKMRFEDKTNAETRIKIMTDGILLQEMKADPLLSRYSVLMVDEAHERSLNIDFILGLLKRVLEERPEFKVIISSATINTQVFSEYFGECPIVKIDSIVYPVTVMYDPPAMENGEDALLVKIDQIVNRIVNEDSGGDILIFLPGEKIIKQCILRLSTGESRRKLHLMPLYGRLAKDEQEKVFDKAPFGKIKVVVGTNIAETSVTIDGITSVIDAGLSKLNHYNPRTFTSSLVEGPIAKASCNQRKGRAGRTQPGICYRLYSRKDFENRPLFTQEEIYRTDLSEVVLRMAELGVTDFEQFDFISSPEKEGIISAIDTLNLLEALNPDRTLSKIGAMMVIFPLLPRHSRIIAEAVLHYPSVLQEVLIATAFLSTSGPYILPPGEEVDARKAHHSFRDANGDFLSYLKLFRAYKDAKAKDKFCEKFYLDARAMAEIVNVEEQLELIVSDMGVPILSGGPIDDYLCSIGRGLIQFVCVRQGREQYRSLTAEKIQIHPGSVMFREDPEYIVAGEIVRTTRLYAMSVSPLQKTWLSRISPELFHGLVGGDVKRIKGKPAPEREAPRDFTNKVKIGTEVFAIRILKGKRKVVLLPWEDLARAASNLGRETIAMYKDMRGTVTFRDFEFLTEEKLETIVRVVPLIDPPNDLEKSWPQGRHFNAVEEGEALFDSLDCLLRVTQWKQKSKELGFVCIFTDGAGNYWYKVSRGFHTALGESISTLEALADELGDETPQAAKDKVNKAYRRLTSFFENE